MRSDPWSKALACHASASAAFAAAAEAVEPAAWDRPRAEGKWSPAQIADHLIQTYDVLLREVAGGAGMKVRTRSWLRPLLKLVYMRRILRGGWFPARAPAPPEIRPSKTPRDQNGAVALFRQRARELETAVQDVRAGKTTAQITHAYFGPLEPATGMLFCGRHIEHHLAQLETLNRAGA
jgi:hypothetical protein